LEPVKRVDIFLDMAEILINQHSERFWQFHVIGDGKLKTELQEQSTRLGISECVTFHGHRKDIPNCIVALDAIIMCSDHEGTPMTALEALALGTPLIAHDVGGLKEILAANNPLSLVQNHSADGYAYALIQFMTQKPDLHELPKSYTARENAVKSQQLYHKVFGNNS
jgi:L-malate glycosyltransferase